MTDSEEIRELEQQLAGLEQRPDAGVCHKLDLLNALAWKLSDIDAKRAYALAETAHALASTPDARAVPCQAGIAYSLRTLGYINQRWGTYALGLNQLLQAQAICEALRLDDALPDVLDGIAGIYHQIGDFPESLKTMLRQLEAAQRIDDKRRIANAYNNLAVMYSTTGDYARAFATLQQNLQLAAEIGYDRIKCLTFLNLAETSLLAGDDQPALDYATRGLRVSREAGFELFEVYALAISGSAHLKMDSAATALGNFDQALALSRSLGSQVTESLLLLDLGRAYRDLQRLDQALDYLQQGLIVATSINARSESVSAHLLLAEVYEQQGDAPQALVHFKQYHALKELVYGEKADERLKVLQVVHDTETARKETEIAYLRTLQLEQEIVERKQTELILHEVQERLEQQVNLRTAELRDAVVLLQREIAERERAEAEIQQMVETLEQRVAARTDELATFFDLTLLAGQATNLGDVFEQVIPRVMEVTLSRALCIHLLDAERTTLLLAGQQNFSPDAHASLAVVHLEADFQRWMQKPHAPLVTMNLAQTTILPVALRSADFRTYLGAQIKIGSRVEGLLSCYRFTDRGFGVDEIALVTALAELVGMMLETQRLRQQAGEMAVVEERQRLARDLHDSVTQTLYSLSLFSRAGREAAEDGDSARLNHSLLELERNTLHALREMRLLLYELRPADLEQEGLARRN